jgi:hypothetical protein
MLDTTRAAEAIAIVHVAELLRTASSTCASTHSMINACLQPSFTFTLIWDGLHSARGTNSAEAATLALRFLCRARSSQRAAVTLL